MTEPSLFVSMDDSSTEARTNSFTIIPMNEELKIDTSILPLQLTYDPFYPRIENQKFCTKVFNIWIETQARNRTLRPLSYNIPAKIRALISLTTPTVEDFFDENRVDLLCVVEFLKDKKKYELLGNFPSTYRKLCEYVSVDGLEGKPSSMSKALKHIELYKNLFNMIHIKEVDF